MPRVLIIESDADFATALQQAFSAKAFEVHHTDDGSQAAKLATDAAPDVIILAAELPKLSGFSVCNRLKTEAKLAAIPVVIVSANSSEETFEQHRRLPKKRAQAYVHKPVTPAELVLSVEKLIGVAPTAAPLPAAPSHDNKPEARGQQDVAAFSLDDDFAALIDGPLDDLDIDDELVDAVLTSKVEPAASDIAPPATQRAQTLEHDGVQRGQVAPEIDVLEVVEPTVLAQSSDAELAGLREQLRAVEARANAAETTQQELRAHNTKRETRFKESLEQIERLEAQISALQQQLSESGRQLVGKEESSNTAKAQKDALALEVQALQTQQQGLTSALEEAQASAQHLEGEVVRLSADLMLAQQRANAAVAETTAGADAAVQLREQLTATESRLAALTEDLETARREGANAHSALAEQLTNTEQARAAEAQARSAAEQARDAEAQARSAEAQARSAAEQALSDEQTHTAEALAAADVVHKALEAERDKALASGEQLRAELATLTTTLEQQRAESAAALNQAVENQTQAVSALEAQLTEARSQAEQLNATLEAAARAAEQQANELRQELETARRTTDDQQRAASEQFANLERDHRAQLGSVRDKLSSLLAELGQD